MPRDPCSLGFIIDYGRNVGRTISVIPDMMEPMKPDMSWWSEGLFISAIFPPLIPTWIGMNWSEVSIISCLLVPAIFLSAVVVTILPDGRLRSRLNALLGGTPIGTFLLIGWCMIN